MLFQKSSHIPALSVPLSTVSLSLLLTPNLHMQRKRKCKQSGVHATKVGVVPSEPVDNPALLLH